MPAKLDVKSIDGTFAKHYEFATNQEAADCLSQYLGKPFDTNYTPIGLVDVRQAAIREAETWIGTPFQMNGAVKGQAIDCGHFLAEVYCAVGIQVPEVKEQFLINWHLHTKTERLLNIILPYAKQVDKPEPGDIVLFKVARAYAHSGIIINWPKIIHARWGSGVEYCDIDLDGDLRKRKRIFLSPFKI